MPSKLYISTYCEHFGAGALLSASQCDECGQPYEFDGWHLGMHEKMAVYQYVYGLKPNGPHRDLADRILTSKRAQCSSCDGRGILTLRGGDRWALCGTCEGTREHWTCSLDEVEAGRRQVLREFPDAAVEATPHNFVAPGLVYDLKAGVIVDLDRMPADEDNVPWNDAFDGDVEALCERIIRKGNEYLSIWGGKAGTDAVYLWQHMLAVERSDGRVLGPFEALHEAIEYGGLRFVNDATSRIDCPDWYAEDIATMFEGEREGISVLINGEPWAYTTEGWTRGTKN